MHWKLTFWERVILTPIMLGAVVKDWIVDRFKKKPKGKK